MCTEPWISLFGCGCRVKMIWLCLLACLPACLFTHSYVYSFACSFVRSVNSPGRFARLQWTNACTDDVRYFRCKQLCNLPNAVYTIYIYIYIGVRVCTAHTHTPFSVAYNVSTPYSPFLSYRVFGMMGIWYIRMHTHTQYQYNIQRAPNELNQIISEENKGTFRLKCTSDGVKTKRWFPNQKYKT